MIERSRVSSKNMMLNHSLGKYRNFVCATTVKKNQFFLGGKKVPFHQNLCILRGGGKGEHIKVGGHSMLLILFAFNYIKLTICF